MFSEMLRSALDTGRTGDQGSSELMHRSFDVLKDEAFPVALVGLEGRCLVTFRVSFWSPFGRVLVAFGRVWSLLVRFWLLLVAFWSLLGRFWVAF